MNVGVHQQFYCVICGGINNLIWIFSLHFEIRLLPITYNFGMCAYCKYLAKSMSVQFLSQFDLVPPYEVAFREYSLCIDRLW